MTEKLSKALLVLVDHTGSPEEGFTLTPASARLLAQARTLTDNPVHAIALNPAPDMAALGAQGVDEVFIPQLVDPQFRIPAAVADAVEACAQLVDISALLCLANYRGREVAARLGVRLRSGAAADVTELTVREGKLQAGKAILGASWTSVFEVTRGIPVIAVRPSATATEPAGQQEVPKITPVPVTFSPEALAVTVESSEMQAGTGRVGLAEAEVVVCGGRGTEGDFASTEALADALGGAVGATRVAADEGWVDRALQIGQTGVSVAPELYVGLGVSGAVHHTCGMQSSRHVVAVCDDPDAPIFEMCDFGVVGDLTEVVPQALTELARLRAGQ